MTDPVRTPDVLDLANALPAQSILILRTFGRPELEALAFQLSDLAKSRQWELLISANPELAYRSGADGVHWPEWSLAQASRPWSSALITASAHNASAIRKVQNLCDAIIVSPVFTSQSPSAKSPKGIFRLAAMAKRSRIPVYALGGINSRTAKRLRKLGMGGIACVSAVTLKT